jgi:hypothetical protein
VVTYQAKTTTAKAAATNGNSTLCTICGRNNHQKHDCRATRCICGVMLADKPSGHNVTDPAHKAIRAEWDKPRDQRTSTRGGRNPGGRNQGGRGHGQRSSGRDVRNSSSASSKSADQRTKTADKGKPLSTELQIFKFIEAAATQTESMNKLFKQHEKIKYHLRQRSLKDFLRQDYLRKVI